MSPAAKPIAIFPRMTRGGTLAAASLAVFAAFWGLVKSFARRGS